MQIKLPRPIVSAWNVFEEWGNVPIWQNERIELVRLDLLLAAAFALVTSWYGWLYGVIGAIQGGALFVVFLAFALFTRR